MVGVKYRLVTLSGRWQASEFRKLWLGDTVSQLGSQVTRLALPLTAIVFLSATPLHVAALARPRGGGRPRRPVRTGSRKTCRQAVP